MLIWLNGPFGVGKTQTAFELHRRLPGSFVCDPELIGFALSRVLPASASGDFQDLELWREFTFRTLDHLLRTHHGPVIVPMSLVCPDYFQQTVGVLRERGHGVHHFTLLAPRQQILRRLRGRGDGERSWPARQLDRCLDALQDEAFAQHVQTEGRTVEQVAEWVASECGLSLIPDPAGSLRRRVRRWWVQLQHIWR